MKYLSYLSVLLIFIMLITATDWFNLSKQRHIAKIVWFTKEELAKYKSFMPLLKVRFFGQKLQIFRYLTFF